MCNKWLLGHQSKSLVPSFRRFNYTKSEFDKYVSEDLATLKLFVVKYADTYGVDGTSNWDWSWTFPKSLLFTITIMTTIGALC